MQQKDETGAVFSIIFSISLVHLLNDAIQASVPAMYPVFKEALQLNYTQIGLITLAINLTASLLQPLVGFYADKHPQPYLLPIGMCSSLLGIILLSFSPTYIMMIGSVAIIGIGSAIFHPEASRVTYLASGGAKRGLAQSIFQLGGNAGTAISPLVVALFIAPQGQTGIIWVALLAIIAIVVQMKVAKWYSNHLSEIKNKKKAAPSTASPVSQKQVIIAMTVLITLIFSKYIYISSINNYLTFYMIEHFGVSIKESQLYLFIFLASSAAGTILGGPIGDRFNRKYVIWFSILGSAPFTLLLPYANEFWTAVLSALIGLIISSAFSAILVYAQELMPGKIGMIAGLFFGLAFGLGGIGAAGLGYIADHTSIDFVIHLTSYLPLLGLLTILLPNLKKEV